MGKETVSLVILAGGEGRRLGLDKLWLRHQGQLVILKLIEQFQDLCSETIVALGRPKSIPTGLNAKFVEDVIPGAGPLSGLHAGLVHISSPLALVLACDMPFVSPQLARLLIDRGARAQKPVVCQIFRFLEPFPGVYPRNLLPVVEKSAQSQYGVQRFLAEVSPVVVPEEEVRQIDPELRSFININTLEDRQKWLSTENPPLL